MLSFLTVWITLFIWVLKLNDNQQGRSGFINTSRRVTPAEMGLETAKLKKEFRERMMAHLFSASFLVFVIVVILVLAGVGMLFGERDFNQISEYWKWTVPLTTTYIGYAIGKPKHDSIDK